MTYEVKTQSYPGRHLAVRKFRGDMAQIGDQMSQAFGAVMEQVSRGGGQVAGPAVACYDMKPDGFDVAAGFVVEGPLASDDDVVPMDIPAGDVATTTHIGPYEELSKAYDAIQAWMAANGREPAGTVMWEEYWSGPEVPQSEARTEIFQPLKPR